MRVTVRLVVAIWVLAFAVIGGFTVFQVRQERERVVHDLARRAALVGEGVREAVRPAARTGSTAAIGRVLRKLPNSPW